MFTPYLGSSLRRWISRALILGLSLSFFGPTPSAQAGLPDTFSANHIIDDATFIAKDSMSVDDIQAFLAQQGSYLATYSEGGRTAAQIIWGAAQGQGEASGTWGSISITTNSGTVSPRVLLVSLQKEQSLITTAAPSQSTLDWALGYGCPDGGGCNEKYRGFTKQVENAAWQFRYNYERARGYASDYQVGQTMTFSNTLSPYNPAPTQAVTLANAATASLYRYTPHVYNGNYNFWKLYRQWFVKYSAQLISRSNNLTLPPGESGMFEVRIKNTGDETWTRGQVNLGTWQSPDRVSSFIREDRAAGNASGWLKENRVQMVESAVAPGQIGTFRFWYTTPDNLPSGTYREYFNLVTEGVGWFDDPNLSWDIQVIPYSEAFKAELVARSANPALTAGKSTMMEVQLKNTGSVTWKQGVVNLGTEHDRDRIPQFIREDRVTKNASGWAKENRVQMVESAVAPGQIGTFRFWYTVPETLAVGGYREYFRPVAENRAWLADANFDLSWDITVATQQMTLRRATWISQSASATTLKPGQSASFEVKFRNDSELPWYQGQVFLGTDRDQDRYPLFLREDRPGLHPSGWTAPNRVGLVDGTVLPGQIGTFRFWYTVPSDKAPGTYKEYFRPVAEHITWMDDWGVHWTITVN